MCTSPDAQPDPVNVACGRPGPGRFLNRPPVRKGPADTGWVRPHRPVRPWGLPPQHPFCKPRGGGKRQRQRQRQGQRQGPGQRPRERRYKLRREEGRGVCSRMAMRRRRVCFRPAESALPSAGRMAGAPGGRSLQGRSWLLRRPPPACSSAPPVRPLCGLKGGSSLPLPLGCLHGDAPPCTVTRRLTSCVFTRNFWPIGNSSLEVCHPDSRRHRHRHRHRHHGALPG